MAAGDAPVIQRPPSQNSGEGGIEEEDALLTGQRTGKTPATTGTSRNANRWQRWREIGLFVWAVVATAVVIVLAVSRTRSSSSLVTDSAAGATAFSCGQKSYNGAISVLPNFDPCGSVMEAAKRMGYTTGLVVTTRITDATPAVFASHVRRREMEDDIAMQMIGETHPLGRMVDLMIGGGRCHFLPNTTEGGCRADDIDVIDVAGKKHDWNYIGKRDDFDNLGTDAKLPLLALFAPTDIPYEIDRRHQEDVYPSLEETAKKALDILSAATQDKDQGFFIMIEGSRIDHAGHANDPAAQVHEVLAYDRAMSVVLDFIEDSDVPTLMVSTSDHETGGLATARQLHEEYPDYLWYPSVLANASHSAGYAAHEYYLHQQKRASTALIETGAKDEETYLKSLIKFTLGIYDTTPAELSSLINHEAPASYIFADMISRRAQTGWSTHGHSGADVNIYTSDPVAAKALRGNHENIEVGQFLRDYLGVNEEMEKVTEKLKKHMHSVGAEEFLGRVPEEEERLDGQDHLDQYHGDHKTKHRRCNICGH
ncbi:Repressible alkaline phosphatase [Pseudocercospora fuligena]|uniref:Alkaline phosphatase n=1 Tax=Pseudocercospora fuligena TaxID=685502 RepID=A0A8H6R8P0_9PEZI|nr:Repressible alkaline phosphatase [Pseudocercospora fuligena]